MKFKSIFTIIFSVFLFSNSTSPAFSSALSDEKIIELLNCQCQKFCPQYTPDKDLYVKGFRFIFKESSGSMENLFSKGCKLQKGEVKGLEHPTIERHFLEIFCFKSINEKKMD